MHSPLKHFSFFLDFKDSEFPNSTNQIYAALLTGSSRDCKNCYLDFGLAKALSLFIFKMLNFMSFLHTKLQQFSNK